jgi:hypothetical protein
MQVVDAHAALAAQRLRRSAVRADICARSGLSAVQQQSPKGVSVSPARAVSASETALLLLGAPVDL